MAYVSVTGWTETTASIEITGLDTTYFQKRFTFYWGESSYSDSHTETGLVGSGGTYSYTYTGLTPGTYYVFGVYIESMQGGSYYYEDEVEGDFTTSGGGGGGGWSLSTYDLGSVSSDLTRTVYGLGEEMLYSWSMVFPTSGSVTFSSSGNADTVAWLSAWNQTSWDDSTGEPDNYLAYDDSSGSGNNFEITWSCDANTVYYLWFRTYSGSEYYDNISVTISTSGGSSWTLSAQDLGRISSETSQTLSSMGAKVLYSWSVTFPTAGSITFSSSGSADTCAWLSAWNQTSWDDATGEPDNSLIYDDDSGSGRNFEITYTCDANTVYYLWFRTLDGNAYSGNVTITISPSSSWSYDAISGVSNISAETLKAVTVSSMTGQYFGVSFANSGTATISVPSGANLDMFVTDGNYGYDTSDGFPYTYTGKATSSLSHSVVVTSGSTYYVWVKGATSSVSGSISVTITPPSSQTWTYTIDTSILDPSTTVVRSYMLNAGYGFYMAVRFQHSGTAVFYTEGSYDDIGYLTSSASGYDPSTGVPYNVIAQNDDGGTNTNFRIEYSVTASTTYYLWFRMLGAAGAGTVTLYVVPPSTSTGGKVWIYTSSGWVQATPYIYTSGGWVQATPYIYTSGGWVQTT